MYSQFSDVRFSSVAFATAASKMLPPAARNMVVVLGGGYRKVLEDEGWRCPRSLRVGGAQVLKGVEATVSQGRK